MNTYENYFNTRKSLPYPVQFYRTVRGKAEPEYVRTSRFGSSSSLLEFLENKKIDVVNLELRGGSATVLYNA